MNYTMTELENRTENIKKLRVDMLKNLRAIEEGREAMKKTRNLLMEKISEATNGDGKPEFSNDSKRQIELDKRLGKDRKYQESSDAVDALEYENKRFSIDLEYDENKVRNIRLGLKIQEGIKE
jgi:NAD+--asparagine ADP-ribosyltransferase